jgi:Abnormal spindle-like microcephaly-assoc'd, ASPM-SPD-2-Hydin/Cep192 domain 4/HYDIN/CFA65/VesB-like, Ig-like domain
LGNGDGTFTESISTSAIEPAGFASGDLNSDGSVDLISANNLEGDSVAPDVALFLSGPFVNLSPPSLAFGGVDVGTPSPSRDLTLANIGNAPMTIANVGTTGDYSQTNGCGDSLAPQANCQIGVTFSPTQSGTRNGSVTITDNVVTSPQNVSLTGVGVLPIGSLSPGSLSFNSQLVGTSSAPQTVTLSNTGMGPLDISQVEISTNFTETNNCNGSVAPNSHCIFQVVFSPTGSGSLQGTLTIIDNNNGQDNSRQTASLSGMAIQPVVSLSPSSASFGSQQVNVASAPQVVALTNTGSAPVTFTSIAASANFFETNTCGKTLAASSKCQINVTFTPTTLGTLNGTLTITDNAPGSPQTVALSGTGLEAEVKFSPASLSFGFELVGVATAAENVKVTNPGNEALAIKSISASGDFAQTNTCGTSLAANGSCTVSVTFKPTAGGARSGMLTVTDNATGSAQTVALTGTGQDFTFGPPSGGSTTSSVSPGQRATYRLSLAGLGGLSQPVAFTCTGAPSESTCTVSPSTVMSLSSPAGVTVTVTTTAASLTAPTLRILPPAGGGRRGPITLWWLLVAALLALTARRLRGQAGADLQGLRNSHRIAGRRYPALAGLALVALMILGMAACGGGGGSGPAPNPGTPVGSYSLTVTGTANTTPSPISHSATLTLTVK